MTAIPRPFTLLQSSRLPGGIFYGLNAQTITGNSSGAWAVAANGTNQNITLTPSGTGSLNITSDKFEGIVFTRSTTAAGGAGLKLVNGASTYWIVGAVGNSTAPASALGFFYNTNVGPKVAIAATSGNLLLGSLTTDGTGVLQFAAHTTNAGGISLGLTQQIWTSTTQVLDLGISGTSYMAINGNTASVILKPGGTQLAFLDSSGFNFTWNKGVTIGDTALANIKMSANTTAGIMQFTAPNGTGSMTFATGAATTALTLDSSQVATFAKEVKSTTGLHTTTATGTGGVSYNNSVPITLGIKSITVLTSGGVGTDVATITIPSGITRYRVTNSQNCAIYAETAAGTLGGAGYQVRDASGGGGSTIVNTVTLPAAASTGVSAPGTDAAAVYTASTLYIRQTANSANTGTVSVYLTITPII